MLVARKEAENPDLVQDFYKIVKRLETENAELKDTIARLWTLWSHGQDKAIEEIFNDFYNKNMEGK